MYTPFRPIGGKFKKRRKLPPQSGKSGGSITGERNAWATSQEVGGRNTFRK